MSEISFGADAPAQWDLLTEAERAKSELGPEQCIIEAEGRPSYFVRACLEVPIKGTDQVFTWGVWVSLSETSFSEMSDHWNDPDRTNLGPYFGWLCTTVPEYPDSMFLKTNVRQRSVGLRPLVELQATDHPLGVYQREGIEPTRLREIVTRLLHPVA